MSNREIGLWLMGSLIAVGVLVWTAIYVMDHYVFAELRPASATALRMSAVRGSCIGQALRWLRKSADILQAALRARITDPSGWCADMPCHGLNAMPSSTAFTFVSDQTSCGCAVIRPTAM